MKQAVIKTKWGYVAGMRQSNPNNFGANYQAAIGIDGEYSIVFTDDIKKATRYLARSIGSAATILMTWLRDNKHDYSFTICQSEDE